MGAGVIAFLLSWVVGGGITLLAVCATILVVYAGLSRLPPTIPVQTLMIIWIAYAGYAGAGLIYHQGVSDADARVAKAVAAEQTRQSAVRAKALDNAATRELAARADANAAEQKADEYAAKLATQPEPVADAKGVCPPRFKLGADDVRDLGVFQH